MKLFPLHMPMICEVKQGVYEWLIVMSDLCCSGCCYYCWCLCRCQIKCSDILSACFIGEPWFLLFTRLIVLLLHIPLLFELGQFILFWLFPWGGVLVMSNRGSTDYWCWLIWLPEYPCNICVFDFVLFLFLSYGVNLDRGAGVQGALGCFSQNLPKAEIVNSLLFWLEVILVKLT